MMKPRNTSGYRSLQVIYQFVSLTSVSLNIIEAPIVPLLN